MNIQQIHYVLSVVDSKNFETAAANCYVSQSTLSTMIGKYEDEIGFKIFNRKTKPVSVTKEGERIIERLRIIRSELAQLDDLVQEIKGEMTGVLQIGVIPTVAPYLLPVFLQKLAAKFPKLQINVRELTTAQIVEDLKKRVLDIGILALPINDSDLKEQAVYVEPFLVYDCRNTPSNEALTVHDLDYDKLWLLQEGHCLRTQVNQICDRSDSNKQASKNFAFESGSMDSLIRFTKANKGMTILPYLATLDFKANDSCRIVPFQSPVPSRSVGLITHKYFVKKRLEKELVAIIKEANIPLIPDDPSMHIIEPLSESF